MERRREQRRQIEKITQTASAVEMALRPMNPVTNMRSLDILASPVANISPTSGFGFKIGSHELIGIKRV
jgi:hypothetical protein